jgi:hypothetical protein
LRPLDQIGPCQVIEGFPHLRKEILVQLVKIDPVD